MAGRDYSQPLTPEMFRAIDRETQAAQMLPTGEPSDEDSTDPEELAQPPDQNADGPVKVRAWPAWHQIAHVPVKHRPHS
eukprot:11541402-Prorocentrum_lima.AAC.1